VDVELTPEGAAIFGDEYREFSTRYNNGPIFGHEEGLEPVGEFAEMTVLANFKTATINPKTDKESVEMIGSAAILSSEYGEGRILLISPHPETHQELYPLVGRGMLWSVKNLEEAESKRETKM